jgi:hypothetical protein
MADRHLAPPLSICLSPEDHEWLAQLAKHEGASPHTVINRAVRFFRFWHDNESIVEAALTAAYFLREYQKQVERRRYFQCEHQMQSRRLHNQRRAYQGRLRNEQDLRRECEKRLRDEQNLRHAYEERLRNEQDLRHAYQRQLRRQRDRYVRQARAAAEANRDALYSPTVARLLAVAVCSESDGEAKAAFTKARALYRIRALSHAPGAGWDESHQATSLRGSPVPPGAS